MQDRIITFSQSINEALETALKNDKNVIMLGLGIDDPKGIFGTTLGLNKKKFSNQVFDMPTCENSFTGFAMGLSLLGKRPILVHQRVEFSLLSMDQIINQAAKWFYMTNGTRPIPMVIRLIIGRGWGQGPQHSQSLETLFSHIPGLKVVCASNAYDAKGLLLSSIKDNNPVIFFEHRWLHETKSIVPKKKYYLEIGKSKYLKKGNDLTIVSFSYSTIQALQIYKILKKNKINADVIDLISLRPLDTSKILSSAKKTSKVLILDNGWCKYGIGSEISAIINEKLNKKIDVIREGNVDAPIPSTPSLAKHAYPLTGNVIKKISKLIKKNIKISKKDLFIKYYDIPNKNFTGPF